MKLYFPILLLLPLFLIGCSTPDNIFISRAEALGEQILNSMSEQRYKDTVELYDDKFFERIDKTGWITILSRIDKKLGPYKSKKITASRVTHGFSTSSTATTVLVYRVYYEKDYTIQKLTFLSTEKAEKMTVIGHYIDYPQQEGEPFR